MILAQPGHVYCQNCIERWAIEHTRPRCPRCKKQFRLRHLLRVYYDTGSSSTSTPTSFDAVVHESIPDSVSSDDKSSSDDESSSGDSTDADAITDLDSDDNDELIADSSISLSQARIKATRARNEVLANLSSFSQILTGRNRH